MKFEIKNRWTGNVQFECELSAEISGQSYALQIGAAVREAVEAKANLSGANLSDAYLRDANLHGANLHGANLHGANLRDAYLRDAYLRDAYLHGANLSGANLSGANLSDANLIGAYLHGAYLHGANLSDANLRGANLSGANLSDELTLVGERPMLAIGPIGSESRTVFAWITDQGMRIQAGCFFGDRAEFLESLESTHGDNIHAQEYRAALVLFDAHEKLWSPS